MMAHTNVYFSSSSFFFLFFFTENAEPVASFRILRNRMSKIHLGISTNKTDRQRRVMADIHTLRQGIVGKMRHLGIPSSFTPSTGTPNSQTCQAKARTLDISFVFLCQTPSSVIFYFLRLPISVKGNNHKDKLTLKHIVDPFFRLNSNELFGVKQCNTLKISWL